MADVYETVEIEDMSWDCEKRVYSYPCPCGDTFSISLDELMDGEEIATCPSCTLTIRVVYDIDKLTAANKKSHAPKSSSAHNFMEDVYKSVDKSAIRGYEKGESKSGESKESSDYQSKDGSSSDYQCKDGSRKDEY